MESIELYELFCRCSKTVCTDSRKITPGCLFIALKGENFNADDFAEAALEAGAAAAITSKVATDPRMYPVGDTLKALQDLAANHRQRLGIPVIGLTGTNGKTTTKELLRAVLSKKYRVHATKGNLNNSIGVPLTLLSIPEDTEIAVVEMGASHPGDIEELVAICQPSHGLINNVGRAHLQGFGSFEGVKATKGELYDYLSSHDGFIFYNSSDAILSEMLDQRNVDSAHKIAYNVEDANLIPGSKLSFEYMGVHYDTLLTGAYNIANAVAAINVGAYFGVLADDIKAAIEEYRPDNSRSEIRTTDRNTLIVDAYNANPSSMNAALDNLASIATSLRKTVLLGQMLELGDYSAEEHQAIVGRCRREGFDAYFVGEEFRKAVEVAKESFPVYESSIALAEDLKSKAIEGCYILVKGSHGTRMENVLPAL